MGKSPLCSRHWKSDTSTWRILSEASFMMDQTLFGQKVTSWCLLQEGGFWSDLCHEKSSWIIHWFSRLGAAGRFGMGRLGLCGGNILWLITISEHEMNGWAFTSCLLINTGFRLMEHDFWNTFFFPIKCSSLTLLALQYHNYTINIKKKYIYI